MTYVKVARNMLCQLKFAHTEPSSHYSIFQQVVSYNSMKFFYAFTKTMIMEIMLTKTHNFEEIF